MRMGLRYPECSWAQRTDSSPREWQKKSDRRQTCLSSKDGSFILQKTTYWHYWKGALARDNPLNIGSIQSKSRFEPDTVPYIPTQEAASAASEIHKDNCSKIFAPRPWGGYSDLNCPPESWDSSSSAWENLEQRILKGLHILVDEHLAGLKIRIFGHADE